MREKIVFVILLIFIIIPFGSIQTTSSQVNQQQTYVCEQCGMNVDPVSQAHLRVVDANGTLHYVECLKCAFKLLKNYDELNITTNCDWYGPNYTITINLQDHINITTVNPTDAVFIDGNCMKNRILSNQTAADAIISNNGTSNYLALIQNVTIPVNATQMTIVQAATKFAFTSGPVPTTSPSPSPSATPEPTENTTSSIKPSSTPEPTSLPSTSPSPTEQPQTSSSQSPSPTKTPTPTATPPPSNVAVRECEVCSMTVGADAQAKYLVIDGSGTMHYVECFMCALNLINDYDQLNITSYCDWYGPNFTITATSSQRGSTITVNPSDALFLNGGSCVINRAAYNQTAADALLANGFSQYTLQEQHYDLPSNTNVTTIAQASIMFAGQKTADSTQNIIVFTAIGVVGAAVVAGSLLAYRKLKRM